MRLRIRREKTRSMQETMLIPWYSRQRKHLRKLVTGVSDADERLPVQADLDAFKSTRLRLIRKLTR